MALSSLSVYFSRSHAALIFRSLWASGTMKPEGYRDTRSLRGSQSISMGSTPTKKRVKPNFLVPAETLNLLHDRHPPLQSGCQVRTMILM